MTWTYSHGFKVPVELLGDFVREFAASYLDTVLRPTRGGLAGDSMDGQIAITPPHQTTIR